MKEKIIEQYLKKRVEETGLCLKWNSPGAAGVPDRICIFPGGRVVFVETKAPTGTVKKIQKEVIRRMRNLGAVVYVASTKEGVDQIIETEAEIYADF